MRRTDCLMVWLVALLVGCSVLTSCSEQKKRTRKAAVKVETLTVGGSNASGKTKDYVGTIEEKTGATLSFELGGNITSIRVDEGDRVSKGQVLATINPTTLNETHRGEQTGAGESRRSHSSPTAHAHQHQGAVQRGGSLEASRHGHVRAAGAAGSEDSGREGCER